MTSALNPAGGPRLVDILDRLRDGREVFFRYVRKVGDLMSEGLLPLDLDKRIQHALEAFQQAGLNELPVVDLDEDDRGNPRDPIFVGCLRRRDVHAIISQFAGGLSQKDSDDRVLAAPVVQHLTRGMPAVSVDTPLFDAITQMVRLDVELLAVTQSNLYLGTLTSLDIIRCLPRLDAVRRGRVVEQRRDMRLMDILGDQESKGQPTDLVIGTFLSRVTEVMRSPAPLIRATDTIADAMKQMEDKGVRALVVVDTMGASRGIVTDLDIQLVLPPVNKKAARLDELSGEGMFDLDREDRGTRQVLGERVTIASRANAPTVSADESVVAVAEKLCEPDVPLLAVVEGGRPKGVVARRDLLRVVLSLGQLAKKRGLLDED